MNLLKRVLLIVLFQLVNCQKNPYWLLGRSAIVHLFEWRWVDIAEECERYLGPNGFAGVQVSPPTENVIVPGRPWYERYQPISYALTTRSGDELAFTDMVKRCNKVGVRIYVDLVVNHMNAQQGVGVSGAMANVKGRSWPAVPYNASDFHPGCAITSYQNQEEVRNCELSGLPDLNQSVSWVRDRIIELMNRCVSLGVAGFRVDGAKHMWPADLEVIYKSVNNLNPSFNFTTGSRPFIYQEVIDLGGEAVKKTEYNQMGAVTEFRFSDEIGKLFHGKNLLDHMNNWGEAWGLLPSTDALVFIDNHDNQRGHGAGGADVLNYKNARLYKMAAVFMLAHPYGIVRLMSSFNFDNPSQGPPADSSGNITPPKINADSSCSGGWVCEHRWSQIRNMVKFRNEVANGALNNWWSNGNNQIAFCRGNAGFVVFNNEATALNQNLQTCLPAGTYCDVISGEKAGKTCTGTKVVVNESGVAAINLAGDAPDGVLAIHKASKL